MALILDGLTKTFQSFPAVNNLTCTFDTGVYGLLGVNGAGKTTLLRMLCTLLTPTAGSVTWEGQDIFTLGPAYRNLLGYLPQEFGFYPDFTVEDYLLYIACLKGLRPATAKRRTETLLRQVGLHPVRRQKMKRLSGGMKRRAGIAQAMLNDPKVLILDEPTAGLDPTGREEILALVERWHQGGRTIMMVSHSMDDVAKYADRILVMNHGTLAMQGTPREVFTRHGELRAMGLDVPEVSKLCAALRDRGLQLPEGLYDLDEMEQAILRIWKGGKATC